MAVQYSPAVRNAMLEGWETAVGTSPKFRIHVGAQPANTAAAASGAVLAEYSLAVDWSANAASGVKGFSGLPITTTGLAAGTAGHYRIVDSVGTTCHEQGTVGTTGTDAIIDNAVIAVGQTVNITAFNKTAPGA